MLAHKLPTYNISPLHTHLMEESNNGIGAITSRCTAKILVSKTVTKQYSMYWGGGGCICSFYSLKVTLHHRKETI